MFKKLSIITVFVVELIAQQQWFVCKQFNNFIHLSSTNQSLYLTSFINNDRGESIFLVRFFHNKVIVFFDLFSRYYLRFWDDRFGLNLFSIIGYFGILLGVWYLVTGNFKNKIYLWIFFIFLLILPLTEIVLNPSVSFLYKIILLSLPFQIFSLFGIWQFLGNNKNSLRIILIVSLIILSIWWINVLHADVYIYCIK